MDEARLEILAKSGGRCWYCGSILTLRNGRFNENGDGNYFSVDHVHPQAKGGEDHPDNLVPVCQSCNSLKGARTLQEFRPLFAQRVAFLPKFTKHQTIWLRSKGFDLRAHLATDVRFWFEMQPTLSAEDQ